jgi:AcrR family transcriptional regulator
VISPRLSRDNIVAIAIEMADRENLAAVTLRGIAARLGVHVTSLYNHVPTKEAVIEGMTRQLVAEAKLPTGPMSWEAWVRQFAAALRALARKHPGAFEAFHYDPAQGERAAAAFESALAAFKDGGFDTVSAYSAVKATIVAVLGFALDETAPRRATRSRTDLRALPPDRYARLREADRIAARVDTYDYLIEALIAGFAHKRRARPASRRRGARGASASGTSASRRD